MTVDELIVFLTPYKEYEVKVITAEGIFPVVDFVQSAGRVYLRAWDVT